MLKKKIIPLLKSRLFLIISTCNLERIPSAAPKFILKCEKNYIYLVDYTFGRIWENLKVNPKASLSLINQDDLTGYQINGSVELIDKGSAYDKAVIELEERKVNLTVERIVQGVRRGASHKSFEVLLPKHLVVFKIKIEEIIEISPTGSIKKE